MLFGDKNLYQLSDKELRIEAAKGVLIVFDSQNKPHRINEASMMDFERFYSLWMVAMQIGGTETFLNAWCFVSGFKETMTNAMKVLGFEDPTKFSPSQLEALLLSYEGNEPLQMGGVLFRFHQTYPKLTAQKIQTGTTSGRMPQRSVILTLPEFTLISNWMAIVRSKLGRCLGYYATWLSKDSPNSPPTKSSEN